MFCAPRWITAGRAGFGIAAALCVGALASAAAADADPVIPRAGDTSAAETIDALQAAGFDTRVDFLEGNPNVPLRECRVTSILNPNGPMASMLMLSTVYVQVACPNAK